MFVLERKTSVEVFEVSLKTEYFCGIERYTLQGKTQDGRMVDIDSVFRTYEEAEERWEEFNNRLEENGSITLRR